MKYISLPAVWLAAGFALLCSGCSTYVPPTLPPAPTGPNYGAHGGNASQTIKTTNTSINQYDLEILPTPIEYSIDISTPEGRAKLSNLSIPQAEALALREAIIANKCATIADPQYTYATNEGRILRVTIYGFPAIYKNQK